MELLYVWLLFTSWAAVLVAYESHCTICSISPMSIPVLMLEPNKPLGSEEAEIVFSC